MKPSTATENCRQCGATKWHVKCWFNLRTHSFEGLRGGAATSPVLDSERTFSEQAEPQEARCVKCGHQDGVYASSFCKAKKLVARNTLGQCGCKCEFSAEPSIHINSAENYLRSAMTQNFQLYLLLNAKSVHKDERHGGSFKGCYQFPCCETNELIQGVVTPPPTTEAVGEPRCTRDSCCRARWLASVVWLHYQNRKDLDPIQQKHLELAMKAGAPFSKEAREEMETHK